MQHYSTELSNEKRHVPRKVQITSFVPSEWSVVVEQKHVPYQLVQPPFSSIHS